MATIDNPVGYIFDQSQKGIEERAAGQLAKYKFQEMREKARSEAAAKQGLASYLGADTPLGKLARTDPKTAMQGIEMQGVLAKTGQDRWKFDIEQRIYNVDQLSGMARAFADAPNPDIYNRFKQLYSQIDPHTVLPSYDVVAADPNKAIQAAISLEGASTQLKHQKALFDVRGKPGEDVPYSAEVEAQRTRMDAAKSAAGRREFAPSEIGKSIEEMNQLPPGSPLRKIYEDYFASKGTVGAGQKAQSTIGKAISDRNKYPVGSPEYNALTAVMDKTEFERVEKINAKKSDLESSRATIDNMLGTVDRLISTKPSVVESATGTISSRLPTIRGDVADFEETLDTLRSQAFLAQIPMMKGAGALSNAEGDKLQRALQSLSLRQTETQLLSNLKEIQRLMKKGRDNLATRYGLPDTPVDKPPLNIEVDF